MYISNEDMESRKRIARLQSAFSDALLEHGNGVMYAELLIVLGRMVERWASELREEELSQ